jgi:hypothetical protein
MYYSYDISPEIGEIVLDYDMSSRDALSIEESAYIATE